MTIAGSVRSAMRRGDARIAGFAYRRFEGFTGHMVAEHKLRQAFEHRHFNRLALAGARRVIQRAHHRDHRL